MKIKRYQNGGISYTPFFRDAAEPTQVATQTSKTSENKEEQLIQKEIINVLKENGLPNDVDYSVQIQIIHLSFEIFLKNY